MPRNSASGAAWSCTASNVRTRSNDSGSASRSNVVRSRTSKVTLSSPSSAARVRAHSTASLPRSRPRNVLFGNRSASARIALPRPHPRSATRIPSSSRSRSPGTSGRMWSKSPASVVWSLSSAIVSWNRRNRSYGTPPPSRKLRTMSSSTWPSTEIHCAVTAMLFGDAARVSHAACSGGSVYVSLSGSTRTMRAAVIAPSHSRT